MISDALDSAIDEEKPAQEWLQKNHFELLLLLSRAINNYEDALDWFQKKELGIFIIIADKIRKYLDDKYLDYHKIHF